MALDFAKEKMLPYASDWDKNKYLPKEVLKELSEMGFATIYVK